MTTFIQAENEIEKEAERFLEMPAIMEERQDSNIVLEKRPELEGYLPCNTIFTDISQGTTNRVMLENFFEESNFVSLRRISTRATSYSVRSGNRSHNSYRDVIYMKPGHL